MKFDPNAERPEFKPWPKGTYQFQVVEAKDKVFKTGAEGIAVKLCLYDNANPDKTTFVYDNLMATAPWRLKTICASLGILESYASGSLEPHDLLERWGKVEVGIKVDTNGVYPARNSVIKYISKPEKTLTIDDEADAVAGEKEDDGVPF